MNNKTIIPAIVLGGASLVLSAAVSAESNVMLDHNRIASSNTAKIAENSTAGSVRLNNTKTVNLAYANRARMGGAHGAGVSGGGVYYGTGVSGGGAYYGTGVSGGGAYYGGGARGYGAVGGRGGHGGSYGAVGHGGAHRGAVGRGGNHRGGGHHRR